MGRDAESRCAARARAVALASTLALLAPGAATASEGESALEAALAAVRAEHVRADLSFFADDELEGRDTPSDDLRVAARFLRARVEPLGFEPASDAGWFPTYTVHVRRIDPRRSELSYEGPGGAGSLAFGADCFVGSLRQVLDVSLEGRAVYCGGGGRDELTEASFPEGEARWALCEDRGSSPTRLARNARRAGAAGLLVLPLANDADEVPDARLARNTSTALRGIVAREVSARDDDELPTLFLTRPAALELLRASSARGGRGEGDVPTPEPGELLELSIADRRLGSGPVAVENVAALWPGADPELRDEVILLSAHYDHVGARGGRVWNGADDNASGSMALVAVAEGLAAAGPLRRSVLLLWVSGEEKGLWGSEAWARSPELPDGARVVCNLNLDMVGRNAPAELGIAPTRDHEAYNGLTRIAEDLAPLEGFPALTSCDEFWSRSDHASFHEHLGIPVAFLHSGEHEDYHAPTDTPEKVDCDKVARVARLVLRMLFALQDDALAL